MVCYSYEIGFDKGNVAVARKKKTDQKPVEDPKSDETVEFTSQRDETVVDADEPLDEALSEAEAEA
ncbi:hypothetical protein DS906_16620, partial [Ruegeria sp. A3M17]